MLPGLIFGFRRRGRRMSLQANGLSSPEGPKSGAMDFAPARRTSESEEAAGGEPGTPSHPVGVSISIGPALAGVLGSIREAVSWEASASWRLSTNGSGKMRMRKR